MRAVDSTWGDVAQDSYIRDRNGTTWRICALDNSTAHGGRTATFRAKNREGQFTTIASKLETEHVTMLVMDEADLIPLLRDKLGATVIGTQDHATKAVTCPGWDEPRRLGVELKWFRDHLSLMHGMYPDDIKTFKQLAEVHAQAHDESEPHIGKAIPHTHA